MRAAQRSSTYTINDIEYQSHRNTKLLKVQLAIVVHISQIPDSLKLSVLQPAVPQHRGGLRVVEMRLAIRERREDLPVFLNLLLLNSFFGHLPFFVTMDLMKWVDEQTTDTGAGFWVPADG